MGYGSLDVFFNGLETLLGPPQMDKDQIIICNLSGRGDKDVQQVAEKVEM